MQGFIQDFVLGEVREKCVEGGTGGGYCMFYLYAALAGFHTEFKGDAICPTKIVLIQQVLSL